MLVNEYIFTITNVSYSVGGFNYKSFARKGESSVYSGIDQLNLLKIRDQLLILSILN